MDDSVIKRLAMELGGAKSTRYTYEDEFQQIQDLMRPFRGDFTSKRSEGDRRITSVFDTTAAEALDTYVGFIMGLMFPSHFDWLTIGPGEKKIEKDKKAMGLLDDAKICALQWMSDSNFYVQINQALKSFSSIGNMITQVDPKLTLMSAGGGDFRYRFDGLRYTEIPLSNAWWYANADGPFKIFREMKLFGIDALEKYPMIQKIPKLKEQLEKAPMEHVVFCHCVFKNEKYIGGIQSAENRPWVSEVFYCGGGHEGGVRVKETGGYDFNPFICARMEVIEGEQYGRGIGHMIKGNAIGMNETMRNLFNAGYRDTNPKLILFGSTTMQEGEDGSWITVDQMGGNQPAPQFMPSHVNYEGVKMILEVDSGQIRRAFLNDAILDPESQPRSAQESISMDRRRSARLSTPAHPITNYLSAIMHNTIAVMMEYGAIPPLAEYFKLTGSSAINLKFISPFFTMQKESIANKIDAVIINRANLSKALGDPSVMDGIDLDLALERSGELRDSLKSVFRSSESIKLRREVRAEQQAQQEMLNMRTQMQGGGSLPSGSGEQSGSAPLAGVEEAQVA